MTLADLEDHLEMELGCFVRIGYLDRIFRKRHKLPQKMYEYIIDYLGLSKVPEVTTE